MYSLKCALSELSKFCNYLINIYKTHTHFWLLIFITFKIFWMFLRPMYTCWCLSGLWFFPLTIACLYKKNIFSSRFTSRIELYKFAPSVVVVIGVFNHYLCVRVYAQQIGFYVQHTYYYINVKAFFFYYFNQSSWINAAPTSRTMRMHLNGEF